MNRRHNNQDGFVSIIVTMILMVFVTLLALGFAFLARQNQRENANRVLSTQAFYAAESAVNDAVKLIKSGGAATEKTSCTTPLSGSSTTDIGSNNVDIKYTCVLYDMAPTSLDYPDIEAGEEKVIKVQAQSGNLSSITISWEDKNHGTSFATNNNHYLPQVFNDLTTGDNLASATGMIRATLIPVYSTIKRDDLTTRAQTVFLYPKAGNGTTNQQFLTSNSLTDPNQGLFLDGNCNTNNVAPARHCNVTIRGLNNGGGTGTFYLRIKALYKASGVTITARSVANPNGANIRLVGEQATIDATGKADNVVRRIGVRLPLSGLGNFPQYAVESVDSICKRLQVWPGGASIGDVPSFANPYNNNQPTTTHPAACKGVATDL